LNDPTTAQTAFPTRRTSDPAPKLPVPVPSSTATLLDPLRATARSGRPSPLKSPTATEDGRDPTVKLVAAPKLPVPVPSSTDTLLDPEHATALPGRPQPLTSP